MDLWTSLFSYLTQVSSKRKLTKFYPPATTHTLYTFKTESPIIVNSSHLMEEQTEMPGVRILELIEALKQAEIVEHKWKMLGKRVYCYNCRAVYSATRKRKFGDEISINGVQRKRAGQTLWGCNICNVALCTVRVVIVGLIITVGSIQIEACIELIRSVTWGPLLSAACFSGGRHEIVGAHHNTTPPASWRVQAKCNRQNIRSGLKSYQAQAFSPKKIIGKSVAFRLTCCISQEWCCGGLPHFMALNIFRAQC
jgi:hypothetical protein